MKTIKQLRHCLGLVKRIPVVVFLCLAGSINPVCYAQRNYEVDRLKREIDDLESQVAKLLSELEQTDSKDDETTTYCFEKIVYKELPAMNNEQFLSFCKKEIPELKAQQGDANYTIVSSCKQTPNGLLASYCITAEPNVVNPLKPNYQKQEIEKELVKIENTKNMYRELISSLQMELKSNELEVADQSLNLGIKQINLSAKEIEKIIKDLPEMKDKMVGKLAQKYNIPKQNIENENAQLVDDLSNMAENLLSYIPGGDKITNHYLWRIFSSTPEIGKILGNSGAIINIYFQIDEFQKKLQQLEERENVLKAEALHQNL